MCNHVVFGDFGVVRVLISIEMWSELWLDVFVSLDEETPIGNYFL